MLRNVLLILFVFASSYSFAQNAEGAWLGNLSVPGATLKIVFNISKSNTGYTATMDSPDQGAYGIAVSEVTIKGENIHIEISAAKIVFEGKLAGDSITGKFLQNGMEFPMVLIRSKNGAPAYDRPQEPKPPFPYYSEEVTFQNKKAGIQLSGTLTLPDNKGKYPTVVMITGSGPQNRDEELMGHKPFLVISDYLTRNGIGVLRFDDRGVGKSQGDFKSATTGDFATDVESALEYLRTRKDVDSKKLGLIGHSEGGLIAPMVAVWDPKVNFIALLSAPGLRGDELILLQKKVIEQKMGVPDSLVEKGQELFAGAYNIVKNNTDTSKLFDEVKNYFAKKLNSGTVSEEVENLTKQIADSWMKYFLSLDPTMYLKQLKCGVLAINGENDLQVPYPQNTNAIKEALTSSGNKNYQIIHFPKLNHLLQESNSGLPQEYSSITQTISPEVLKSMTDWILQQVKK